MRKRGAESYVFEPPSTMKEARARLRTTTISIMDVEKQLGDRHRETTMKDYGDWRERTKAARIFLVMELRDLKAWMLDRRRQLEANRLELWESGDPRALLQRAVLEGRRALRGEANQLEEVLALADLFLVHDA